MTPIEKCRSIAGTCVVLASIALTPAIAYAQDPMLGEIRFVGFTFAPRGWANCDGQLMSVAQNPDLYSVLGTKFGGNGVTTFALPDLRGRSPIGPRQGPGLSNHDLGEVGGVETVTLNVNELPAHQHLQPASDAEQDTNRPGNAVPARGGVYAGSSDGTTLDPTSIAGGNQPHENRPPYLGLNYIIALEGIFPSRN
jgi:microcystin-dependent protein